MARLAIRCTRAATPASRAGARRSQGPACWALSAALLLTGCTGGVGVAVGGSTAAAPGPQAQVEGTRATWQMVDLVTGEARPLAAPPAVAGDLADRWLLVRLVPAGLPAAYGQAPGSFARQDGEIARSGITAGGYIAVCETTRAQWLRIAGSAPWSDPLVAGIDGGGSSALPATGIGLIAARSALAAWSAAHAGELALPDEDAWEAAARGGAPGAYPWGDDRALATVQARAVVRETGAGGPAAIGGRLGNAFGLQDVAGNVWELTAQGSARGGSWADALALARCANRREVPPDGWPTVGLRLVWRP